jgi:hypothetical protein
MQSLIVYLILNQLPFWIIILETIFLASSIVSLLVSLSNDPVEGQLWISFTTTRIALVIGAATIVSALLFANNPFDYVFILPGPLMMTIPFFGRRATEREIKFRKRRNARAGEYGNLEGIVAELSPYGYTPEERSWKMVFFWAGLIELLAIQGIFRAESHPSSNIPITSPLFWMFFLEIVIVAGIIGLALGLVFTEVQRRWLKAVTGQVRLDALDKSHLFFYGNNGAFACYKLFNRPMVTEMNDGSLVVARWPASFYVRTSSVGDYQMTLSVLQDTTNYETDGRKVSNKP